VREAFIHLSKEGLVEVIPQKETRVSLIDLVRVEQEFFLRNTLETAVYEPFLRNNGSRYFSGLENLISLQRGALKSKSYIEFIKYDDRFHEVFFEVANQRLSWEVLASMSGHYHRVRMLSILEAGVADEKVEYHRKILSALKKGCLEGAKENLYLHLHNPNEEKMFMEKFPGYFASREAVNKFDVDFGGFPILLKTFKGTGDKTSAVPAAAGKQKK